MADLTETLTPYEVLIRYGADGVISGWHCAFILRVLRDGKVISEQPQPPLNAKQSEEAGFPLKDLLGTTLVDALITIEEKQKEINQLIDQLIRVAE